MAEWNRKLDVLAGAVERDADREVARMAAEIEEFAGRSSEVAAEVRDALIRGMVRMPGFEWDRAISGLERRLESCQRRQRRIVEELAPKLIQVMASGEAS